MTGNSKLQNRRMQESIVSMTLSTMGIIVYYGGEGEKTMQV